MAPAQGRKRRARPEPEEGDEDEEDSATAAPSPEPATQRRRVSGVGDDDGYGSDAGAAPDSSTQEMVKKMVRLALACEYQRKPIRRAEVSEKVLGPQGRQFKKVFEEAQGQLRSVFGMEMVELPAREKVTVREKRGRRDHAQGKAAASWVLRSTLPSVFHDPQILPPSAVPTSAEEGTYTAIYTVLISLISLSGGSLPDAKLERYLRRLGMEDHSPIPNYTKTELLLKHMEREGYILKVKETATAGEEDVSWHVGPRGKVEVGDDGVRGLTNAVYGDLVEEDDTELQRRITRSLGIGDRPAERRTEDRGVDKSKKKAGRKRKDEQEEDEAEEEGDDDDDE